MIVDCVCGFCGSGPMADGFFAATQLLQQRFGGLRAPTVASGSLPGLCAAAVAEHSAQDGKTCFLIVFFQRFPVVFLVFGGDPEALFQVKDSLFLFQRFQPLDRDIQVSCGQIAFCHQE